MQPSCSFNIFPLLILLRCIYSIEYSYHGNYLLIDEQLLAFNEALSYCQNYFDTTLATIYSQSQNDEAFHLCSQSTKTSSCSSSTVCWIGGYNIYYNISNRNEAVIIPQWIDGSNMNYTNFYKSYTQSIQFEGKCIRINTANNWHPVDCDFCVIRFLCNNYDKTIKGHTPSPTLPPIQILSIDYEINCNIMQSLECTQTIQSNIDNGEDVEYNVIFNFDTFNILQCKHPKLSIIFEDIDFVPFPNEYLKIYINNKYTKTCYATINIPGCNQYIECLNNYDLSMDSISNINIKLLKSKEVNAFCNNHSLNINISISCQDTLITTLNPTPAPTNLYIKSKTVHITDSKPADNSYSITLKDKTHQSQSIKYRAIFDFQNGECYASTFKVDVRAYTDSFSYSSNISVIMDNDLYTLRYQEKAMMLQHCYDGFNVFLLDINELFNRLEISSIILLFPSDDMNECEYQFTVNTTIWCIEEDTDNYLESGNSTNKVFVSMIIIFGLVMVGVLCICLYVKRNSMSQQAVGRNGGGGDMEMGVLQQEGIGNFDINDEVHENNKGEGELMRKSRKKCSKKREKGKMKQIEGDIKKEYKGLDVDALDSNLNENQNDNGEAPKAFAFEEADKFMEYAE